MKNPIKDTISILWGDSPCLFIFGFLLTPIVFALLPFCIKIESIQDVSGNIISGLSLFVGILFSIIIVVSDKVQSKKEISNANPTQSNTQRTNAYIKFGQQSISLIYCCLYVSLSLILLLILCQFKLDKEYEAFNSIWLKANQFIINFLSAILFLLVFYVLKYMRHFFYGIITH